MYAKKSYLLEYLNSYGSFLKGTFFESSLKSIPRSEGLKFSTDLGQKAVVMNDSFENMDAIKKTQIADMFGEGDLGVLLGTKGSRWLPRKFRNLFANEGDLMVGNRRPSDSFVLYDKDNATKEFPRGLVTTFFSRTDVGRNSQPEGSQLVPLAPSQETTMAKALKLPGEGRWALALFHPGRRETLLFPIDDATLSFLTEVPS